MNTITCPKCGTINPENTLNCKSCKINLRFALENPAEVERIKKEELERLERNEILNLMEEEWKCPKCNTKQSKPPMLNNHCPHCNEPIVTSRLNSNLEYPKVTDPPEFNCYAARRETVVLAKPELGGETLYVIGYGDILEIDHEEGDFYQLLLPGGDKGYALKGMGIKVPFGKGEVEKPLGYVRLIKDIYNVRVTVLHDEKPENIYTLSQEDRFPVVAENEDEFMIQLRNGLRGWVRKGSVIRTLSPDSLPQQASSDLATVLGAIALFGIALVGGVLSGNTEESKMKKTIDRELQKRGL